MVQCSYIILLDYIFHRITQLRRIVVFSEILRSELRRSFATGIGCKVSNIADGGVIMAQERTQERLKFAIELLVKNDIEFSLKNEQTGHLHCRSKLDDSLVQFWAGTGKIMGYEEKGIHNLVKILTEGV